MTIKEFVDSLSKEETDAVNYVSVLNMINGINNGKIIFKDILEDEFDMVVNFLIRNHHLIECCKLWNRYLLFQPTKQFDQKMEVQS